MRTIVVALLVVLGGSAVALATPVAEAGPGPDVCLSYWYCVIHCNTPPDYYCKCRPECPPPPEEDW